MATITRTTVNADGTKTVDQVPVDPISVNADTVRQKVQAYLALSTTTATQDKKAIKGLIRLLLNLLDDVSDT